MFMINYNTTSKSLIYHLTVTISNRYIIRQIFSCGTDLHYVKQDKMDWYVVSRKLIYVFLVAKTTNRYHLNVDIFISDHYMRTRAVTK